MTALPRTGPSLAWKLLQDGIPPSLLIDLLDPTGMKAGLAHELALLDVERALAPALQKWIRRSA
ncbi:MAG: hypothetical protein JWO12_1090 [Frankiales bacterium]|nr:hypothetical protein [Frankiales bacterium]